MKKVHLNKIVGTLSLILIFGFLFFLSWFFFKAEQVIEGPHIFYHGDTIKSLTINITGNKQEKTFETIDPPYDQVPQFKMQAPDGQQIILELYDKIETPKDYYEKTQNVFVVSDIEGDFDFLKDILIGNNVIDKKYNWTYGKGHLVVVGDIFDRGSHVTECLWLLYKLEKDANTAGGQVHVILGNHEIMALQGDHRYINKKYKKLTNHLQLEYKDLYSSSTEIGRWLRTKNAIEVIDRTLFVHGGLSTQLVDKQITISQINDIVRKSLNSKDVALQDSNAVMVMGKMGPLWYRGYIENPIVDRDVKKIVDFYDIDKIAIGHTVVKEITPLYDSKIFAIDAKRGKGSCTALLIEKDNYYTVTDKGEKKKL